jgi:hypothetical protein
MQEMFRSLNLHTNYVDLVHIIIYGYSYGRSFCQRNFNSQQKVCHLISLLKMQHTSSFVFGSKEIYNILTYGTLTLNIISLFLPSHHIMPYRHYVARLYGLSQ